MSTRVLILTAALLAGCRAKTTDEPPPREPSTTPAATSTEPGSASTPTPAPPQRDFLGYRRGIVHGETETFVLDEQGPACGAQACGNGRRDSCTIARHEFDESWTAEACDGPPEDATCERLGYVDGELGCSDTCRWDTSRCAVCPPDRCVPHRLSDTGEGALLGMGAASDGSRVRLVWGTQLQEEGRQSVCLYTAWAEDDDPPQLLGCDLATFPLLVYLLEPGPDGTFELEIPWGREALRGTLNAEGTLVTPRVEEREPWGTNPQCQTIDAGPLELRIRTAPDNEHSETPLWGWWYQDQEPLGEPFRIAHDPLAIPCAVGAVVDETMVLTWVSLDRGLVTTRVPVPTLAERVDELADELADDLANDPTGDPAP